MHQMNNNFIYKALIYHKKETVSRHAITNNKENNVYAHKTRHLHRKSHAPASTHAHKSCIPVTDNLRLQWQNQKYQTMIVFWFVFCTLLLGISPMGNLGRFSQQNPAAAVTLPNPN